MTSAGLEQQLARSYTFLGRQTQERLFKLLLVVGDVAALATAFGFAYLLRFESNLPLFEDVDLSHADHVILSLLLLPCWLAVFALFHLYDLHYLLGGDHEYARVFNASSVVLTLLIVATFLFPVIRVSRGWIALAWGSGFLIVIVTRFFLRRVGYALRRRGMLASRTLIVGADNEGRAIAEQLLSAPTSGAEVIGFIDNRLPVGSRVQGDLVVLGTVENLTASISSLQIKEVILSSSALHRTEILNVFQELAYSDDVELRFSTGLFEIFTTGVRVREIGSVPLVSMNKVRLAPLETVIKTCFDYVVAGCLLFLLAPLFLALAIMIKRDSPGPVFHRRRVLGQGGRAFDALKFRTMHVNGNEILANNPELIDELRQNHKLKDDPRVTRLGEWLRRLSIDEFAQLFNVLLGQMSLVGPRMITIEEAEKYGKWRLNLLTVKPGLTGLWQVSGRSDLTYDDRVRLDMYYIRNYSLWLDAQILIQTPGAVLRGSGAY